MALRLFSQFPVSYSYPSPTASPKTSSYPEITTQIKPTTIRTQPIFKLSKITRITIRKTTQFAVKAAATEEENPKPTNNSNVSESQSEPQTVSTQQSSPDDPQPRPTNSSTTSDLSELGSEIKKAMREREGRDGVGVGGGGGDFWSGVAEEIREIEWPAFGKVLGTTGVVLGVIAGSSVVLLTVNAVLAELSDRVFAGKGVQDFFS